MKKSDLTLCPLVPAVKPGHSSTFNAEEGMDEPEEPTEGKRERGARSCRLNTSKACQ